MEYPSVSEEMAMQKCGLEDTGSAKFIPIRKCMWKVNLQRGGHLDA